MSSQREQHLTKVLTELLGFAERNFKRAQGAHADAKVGPSDAMIPRWVTVMVMEAREHEAQRFLFVVRERLAEAGVK